MINPKEINDIVVQIEIAYRNEKNLWNRRLRQINPSEVRRIMFYYKIGIQCEKCLLKSDSERYCCKEHSEYYTAITNSFYGTNYPFIYDTFPRKDGFVDSEVKVKCPICGHQYLWSTMSIDHIVPITKGGLEFDRNNLQFMCLKCNIRKYNHTAKELNAQKKLSD